MRNLLGKNLSTLTKKTTGRTYRAMGYTLALVVYVVSGVFCGYSLSNAQMDAEDVLSEEKTVETVVYLGERALEGNEEAAVAHLVLSDYKKAFDADEEESSLLEGVESKNGGLESADAVNMEETLFAGLDELNKSSEDELLMAEAGPKEGKMSPAAASDREREGASRIGTVFRPQAAVSRWEESGGDVLGGSLTAQDKEPASLQEAAVEVLTASASDGQKEEPERDTAPTAPSSMQEEPEAGAEDAAAEKVADTAYAEAAAMVLASQRSLEAQNSSDQGPSAVEETQNTEGEAGEAQGTAEETAKAADGQSAQAAQTVIGDTDAAGQGADAPETSGAALAATVSGDSIAMPAPEKVPGQVPETPAQAPAQVLAPAQPQAPAPAQKTLGEEFSPEFEALCRIVQAEAGGEDTMGKILVANVVLNRVASPHYPNSVREVVFQSGQFSPIRDGSFSRANVSSGTIEAVQRALAGENYAQGALFFNSGSRLSRTMVLQHGGHRFYI